MNDKGNMILIVDDNKTNIGVLISTLKSHGFKTITARNGPMGIRRAEFSGPDLILLDVMMPGIDGFETCRRLKADDRTKDIPVIFMTALSDVKDKLRGFELGGVDYITKPFQAAEVLARVETHLTLRTLQKAVDEKNARLEEKNRQLEEALANVRTLRGLLPICANCKKIRDGKGYWKQTEEYIEAHSDARFSHGICEECSEKLYGNQEWYRKKRDGTAQ